MVLTVLTLTTCNVTHVFSIHAGHDLSHIVIALHFTVVPSGYDAVMFRRGASQH
jgi:hypothetical protein